MARELVGDYEDLINLNKRKNLGFRIFFILYIITTVAITKFYYYKPYMGFDSYTLVPLMTPIFFSIFLYSFAKLGFSKLFLLSNKDQIKEYLDSIIKNKFKSKINFSTKLSFSQNEADFSDLYKEYTKSEISSSIIGFNNNKRFKGANLKVTKTTGSGKSRRTETLFEGFMMKIYMNGSFSSALKITTDSRLGIQWKNYIVYLVFLAFAIISKEITFVVFVVLAFAINNFKTKIPSIKLKDENFDKVHDVFSEDKPYAESIIELIKKDIMNLHLSTEVNVCYSMKDRYLYIAVPNTKILDPLYEKGYREQLDQVFDLIDIINCATKMANNLDEELTSLNS